MYEVFKLLFDAEKISLAEFARRAGVPASTITDWRAGRYTPKKDKLQKIADYFDVSLQYLETGHEDPTHISREEQRLLDLFRRLNRAGRDMLFAQADLLAGSPVYQRGTEKSSVSDAV